MSVGFLPSFASLSYSSSRFFQKNCTSIYFAANKHSHPVKNLARKIRIARGFSRCARGAGASCTSNRHPPIEPIDLHQGKGVGFLSLCVCAGARQQEQEEQAYAHVCVSVCVCIDQAPPAATTARVFENVS